MSYFPPKKMQFSRRRALWLMGGLAGGVALHGCTQSSNTSTTAIPTLIAGVSPWPGYSGHYVAMGKDLFKAEGINVQETFFQSASELVTGFLAGKVDIASTTSGDAIEMIHKDPTIRMIYVVDYSDGSDGIIGRDINSPADLKGKTVGRENLLFENVLLRAYLEKGGLTEADIVIRDLTAADAATAFAAKRVDAAVSYEPWMTKAAKEGGGEVIFSTKDTNLIVDTIVTRQPMIETRAAELQAYIRACAQAVGLVNGGDAEAIKIAGDKLGVSPEEMKAQLSGVKVFDIEGNKTIAFNPSSPNNMMKNLELTVKVAYDSKLIPEPMDISSLYDDSIVKSL